MYLIASFVGFDSFIYVFFFCKLNVGGLACDFGGILAFNQQAIEVLKGPTTKQAPWSQQSTTYQQ